VIYQNKVLASHEIAVLIREISQVMSIAKVVLTPDPQAVVIDLVKLSR
jgi:hypothetical protein